MSIRDAAKGLIRDENVSEGLSNMIEMAYRAYDPCFACASPSARKMRAIFTTFICKLSEDNQREAINAKFMSLNEIEKLEKEGCLRFSYILQFLKSYAAQVMDASL